jgi:hypothetical protein
MEQGMHSFFILIYYNKAAKLHIRILQKRRIYIKVTKSPAAMMHSLPKGNTRRFRGPEEAGEAHRTKDVVEVVGEVYLNDCLQARGGLLQDERRQDI